MANSQNLGFTFPVLKGPIPPTNPDMLWLRTDGIYATPPYYPWYYSGIAPATNPLNWLPLIGASSVNGYEFYFETNGTDNYTTDFSISASATSAVTTYVTGQLFKIKFRNANTGPVTLEIDTTGISYPVYKQVSQPLVAGDILAGEILLILYDGFNRFQAIGKIGSTTLPTGTVEGQTLRWNDVLQLWVISDTWNVDGVAGEVQFNSTDGTDTTNVTLNATNISSSITNVSGSNNIENNADNLYEKIITDVANNAVYTLTETTGVNGTIQTKIGLGANTQAANIAIVRLGTNSAAWAATRRDNVTLKYTQIGCVNALGRLNISCGDLPPAGSYVHISIPESQRLLELDIAHTGGALPSDMVGFNSTFSIEGSQFSINALNNNGANSLLNSQVFGAVGSQFNQFVANIYDVTTRGYLDAATFVSCILQANDFTSLAANWINVFSNCAFFGLKNKYPQVDAYNTTFVHSLCKLGGEQKNAFYDPNAATYVTPTTISLNEDYEVYILDGSLIGDVVTFDLPATPYNGQTYTVMGVNIFAFNIELNPNGNTIYDASTNTSYAVPIVFTSAFCATLTYELSTTTWYITGNLAGSIAPPIPPAFTSVVVNTSPYALALGTSVFLVDTTSAVIINLPPAAANSYITIKDATGGANAFNITINGNGGDTIDGQASILINVDYGSVTLYNNATNNWSKL